MSNKRVNPFRLKLQMLELENDNLIHENRILSKALELMSVVLCTGARKDLENEISKFSLREDVIKFFKQQAAKELKNE